ncbi:MAG: hypothetical protein ACKVQJ_00370, partial [Pyrinomonadaceae bacterium]
MTVVPPRVLPEDGLAEVSVGGAMTVSVKLCVALGFTPFVAVIVSGYVPPVPAPGVPDSTPPDESVTPDGKVLTVEKVGAGKPVAVAVNVPAAPTVNVV